MCRTHIWSIFPLYASALLLCVIIIDLQTKKAKKKRTRAGHSAARACFKLMILCCCQTLRIAVEKSTRINCRNDTERNIMRMMLSIQRASISTSKLLMQYDSPSHRRMLPRLKWHASLKLTFGLNAYKVLISTLMMIDYPCYRVLALKKSLTDFLYLNSESELR